MCFIAKQGKRLPRSKFIGYSVVVKDQTEPWYYPLFKHTDYGGTIRMYLKGIESYADDDTPGFHVYTSKAAARRALRMHREEFPMRQLKIVRCECNKATYVGISNWYPGSICKDWICCNKLALYTLIRQCREDKVVQCRRRKILEEVPETNRVKVVM